MKSIKFKFVLQCILVSINQYFLLPNKINKNIIRIFPGKTKFTNAI